MSNEPLMLQHILLVEDSPHDVEFTEEAIDEINATRREPITLSIARNGEEALAFLSATTSLPNLILLDLKMPRMGGIEFLEILKQPDNHLRYIPVVVLTTSDDDLDVIGAYNRYCSAYIQKPVIPDKFNSVIASIGQFWLDTVKLPPDPRRQI